MLVKKKINYLAALSHIAIHLWKRVALTQHNHEACASIPVRS